MSGVDSRGVGKEGQLMTIDDYEDRVKNVGVLYVDLYPYHQDKEGQIEFLVLRRKADVELANTWQTISGKIKKGQTISQTFWMQAQKRTGISPSEVFKIDHVNTFYDDHYDTVMLVPVAACRLDSKEVQLSDLHVEYRWVPAEEIGEFLIWPNQRLCVELINNMLRNRSLITKFHMLDNNPLPE